MYGTVRLEIFTVYPATQNLVLPLIWFHSVHLWPRTNLRKLTFETTLVTQDRVFSKSHFLTLCMLSQIVPRTFYLESCCFLVQLYRYNTSKMILDLHQYFRRNFEDIQKTFVNIVFVTIRWTFCWMFITIIFGRIYRKTILLFEKWMENWQEMEEELQKNFRKSLKHFWRFVQETNTILTPSYFFGYIYQQLCKFACRF